MSNQQVLEGRSCLEPLKWGRMALLEYYDIRHRLVDESSWKAMVCQVENALTWSTTRISRYSPVPVHVKRWVCLGRGPWKPLFRRVSKRGEYKRRIWFVREPSGAPQQTQSHESTQPLLIYPGARVQGVVTKSATFYSFTKSTLKNVDHMAFYRSNHALFKPPIALVILSRKLYFLLHFFLLLY